MSHKQMRSPNRARTRDMIRIYRQLDDSTVCSLESTKDGGSVSDVRMMKDTSDRSIRRAEDMRSF